MHITMQYNDAVLQFGALLFKIFMDEEFLPQWKSISLFLLPFTSPQQKTIKECSTATEEVGSKASNIPIYWLIWHYANLASSRVSVNQSSAK